MPSHACHLLAGTLALSRSLPRHRLSSRSAFALGCQGPDIFAHNRSTRPFALAYARLLHRGGYGTFCAAFAQSLPSASPSERALLLDWFLGCITHQAVDRAIHPFIVYRSSLSELDRSRLPRVTAARFHAFLERIIDVGLVRHYDDKPISAFDTGEPFSVDDSQAAVLARAIGKALRGAYEAAAQDEEIERRITNAFTDAMRFYAMTNPRRTTLSSELFARELSGFIDVEASGVALLFPERLDEGVDWLNLARRAWLDPVLGTETRASVPDLLEEAVIASSGSIHALTRYLSLADESLTAPDEPRALDALRDLEETIGNDALGARDRAGKASAALYADPFDLVGALQGQLALRRIWAERANRPL